MGDFINFLFDRYDRSVVVLSLSWSGGDRNYTDTTTIPKRVGSYGGVAALRRVVPAERDVRKMAVDAGRVHPSQTGEASLQTPLRRGGRS